MFDETEQRVVLTPPKKVELTDPKKNFKNSLDQKIVHVLSRMKKVWLLLPKPLKIYTTLSQKLNNVILIALLYYMSFSFNFC